MQTKPSLHQNGWQTNQVMDNINKMGPVEKRDTVLPDEFSLSYRQNPHAILISEEEISWFYTVNTGLLILEPKEAKPENMLK